MKHLACCLTLTLLINGAADEMRSIIPTPKYCLDPKELISIISGQKELPYALGLSAANNVVNIILLADPDLQDLPETVAQDIADCIDHRTSSDDLEAIIKRQYRRRTTSKEHDLSCKPRIAALIAIDFQFDTWLLHQDSIGIPDDPWRLTPIAHATPILLKRIDPFCVLNNTTLSNLLPYDRTRWSTFDIGFSIAPTALKVCRTFFALQRSDFSSALLNMNILL